MSLEGWITLIVGSVVTFLLWSLQRKVENNEKQRKDDAREQRERDASVLGVVQTSTPLLHQISRYAINDGCNGNTKEQLEKSEKTYDHLCRVVQNRAYHDG